MDARRLGMRIALPRAFLQAAAPGYLTDAELDALDEGWLEQALAYTAKPVKGLRGPLTRDPPRLAGSRASRPGSLDSDEQPTGGYASSPGGQLYRLADYLDEQGRRLRYDQMPPAEFWSAAVDYSHPGDQVALAAAARARGLYQDAARLLKNAAANGVPRAAADLIDLLHRVYPADSRPAQWAVTHASLEDARAVDELVRALRDTGAQEQAAALAARIAADAPLGDPLDAISLLGTLWGHFPKQAAALADRCAAARIRLDDPDAAARLLEFLRRCHFPKQAAILADRCAAAHVPLDDPDGVAHLLRALRDTGAQKQAAMLADRAARDAALDDALGVAHLLKDLLEAGVREQVTVLLRRNPAARVFLDRRGIRVTSLRASLAEPHQRGQHVGIAALTSMFGRFSTTDDPHGVAELLHALRQAGAGDQVKVLADRAAAGALPDHPAAVARLLSTLREVGAHGQAAELTDRAATHAPLLGHLDGVAEWVRREPAHGKAAVLAAGFAAYAPLDDTDGVAELLHALHETSAQEQATALDPPRRRQRYPRRPRRRDQPAGRAGARPCRVPPRLPPPPAVVRAPWAACWAPYGRWAPVTRPQCWPLAPRPSSPSATRAPSPAY
jgi:hypothetical protein